MLSTALREKRSDDSTTTKISLQVSFYNYQWSNGDWGFDRTPRPDDNNEERTLTDEQVVAHVNDRMRHVIGLLDTGDDLLISIRVRSTRQQEEEDVSEYFLKE